jgi:hypothetical protein
MWKWSAFVVAAVLSIGVIVGFASAPHPVGLVAAFEVGVSRLLGRQVSLGGVEEVLLGLAVLALARRTYLAWLAYRPGPVMVMDFVDGRHEAWTGSGPSSASGTGAAAGPPVSAQSLSVTNDVREALTRVAMFPPRADDARSSAQFLNLMRSQGGGTGPFAWVGGLMLFARPTHAYRVAGTLQNVPSPSSSDAGIGVDEDGRPLACGLTIQATVLPSGTSGVHTIWASDWASAAGLAANVVAAFVVPRSRAAKEQPWRALRGAALEPDMFAEFQRARQLVRGRRYDEALRSYEQLLVAYPGNLDLKLEFGDVQERLGLFLDALAVYTDVVRRTDLGDRTDRSTTRLRDRILIRPRALIEKRHLTDPLLARYRLAMALSTTPKTSSQWLETRDVGEQRQRERVDARLRIGLALLDWYSPAFADHEVLARYDIAELMSVTERPKKGEEVQPKIDDMSSAGNLNDPTRDSAWHASHEVKERAIAARQRHYDAAYRRFQLLVELVFLVAARYEMRGLARGYSWEKMVVRGTLTKRAFALSEMIIDHRMRGVLNELAVHGERTDLRPLASAEEVRRSVDRVLRPRFGGTSRSWIDQYNAACVFASAYRALHWYENLPSDLRSKYRGESVAEEEEELALSAVYGIEEAMRFADLRFVADRKNWILSEDPDLDELREHPLFHAFEVRQFTSLTRLPPRASNVHRYEASRYSQSLVAEVAAEMAHRWDGRNARSSRRSRAQVVRNWLEQDTLVWSKLRDFTGDLRHVGTRLALLDAINSTRPHGQRPLVVAYPSWTATVSTEASDTAKAVDDRERKHEQRLNVNLAKLNMVLSLHESPTNFLELHRALSQGEFPRATERSSDSEGMPAPKPVLRSTKAWQRYLDREEANEVHALTDEAVADLIESRASAWGGVRDWFKANDKGRSTLNLLSTMPPAPQDISPTAALGKPRLTGAQPGREEPGRPDASHPPEDAA